MNNPGMEYLATQAAIGISRHPGGPAASRELLARCHISDARSVLNVGCGIGAGSVDVAQQYGCRVVSIDLLPAMIDWARRRAHDAGAPDRITFSTADVLHLPFPDDSFDVVYAESVLLFVPDKAQAIQECIRVVRPGGSVGLNEPVWLAETPADMATRTRNLVGPYVASAAAWRPLWETTALRARTMNIHPLDIAVEMKSRVQCGWPWFLRAEMRAARLYATDPSARRRLKDELALSRIVLPYAGYGLFVGMK